jgi:hypothetical protein
MTPPPEEMLQSLLIACAVLFALPMGVLGVMVSVRLRQLRSK